MEAKPDGSVCMADQAVPPASAIRNLSQSLGDRTAVDTTTQSANFSGSAHSLRAHKTRIFAVSVSF